MIYEQIPELFKQLFTKGGLGEDKIADGVSRRVAF